MFPEHSGYHCKSVHELQVWHYRPFLWDSADPHVLLELRMSCCILCGLRDTFSVSVPAPSVVCAEGLLLALMNYHATVGPRGSCDASYGIRKVLWSQKLLWVQNLSLNSLLLPLSCSILSRIAAERSNNHHQPGGLGRPPSEPHRLPLSHPD